eukprot:3119849-Rhodomonas_salina.2
MQQPAIGNRDECDRRKDGASQEASDEWWGKGPGSLSNTDSSPSDNKDKDWQAKKTAPAALTKPKGALAQFFNPSWERKRAFVTAQDALSALRALLMTRSEVCHLPQPNTRSLKPSTPGPASGPVACP